jgi:hypothetical protein
MNIEIKLDTNVASITTSADLISDKFVNLVYPSNVVIRLKKQLASNKAKGKNGILKAITYIIEHNKNGMEETMLIVNIFLKFSRDLDRYSGILIIINLMA